MKMHFEIQRISFNSAFTAANRPKQARYVLGVQLFCLAAPDADIPAAGTDGAGICEGGELATVIAV